MRRAGAGRGAVAAVAAAPKALPPHRARGPDFKLLTKKYEDEAAASEQLRQEVATLRAQLAAFAPDEVGVGSWGGAAGG